MAYLRRPKQIRTKKRITGDQPIQPIPSVSQQDSLPVDLQIDQLESEFDDQVKLSLLDKGEEKLNQLEDKVKDNLKDLAVILDPETNMSLIRAASQLKQEPTSVIDFEVIDRAVDIAMDSHIHGGGFDPVAVIMGFYGADERGMPLAPVPRIGMDCIQMQNLDNVPDPGDKDYELDTIDNISMEAGEFKLVDLLRKLWLVLKYFPGTDIVSMLKKMLPKKKWYTKLIRKVIKKTITWVECKLVNPAYFLLFGEARSCKEEDEATETEPITATYDFDPESLSGTGMDCIEASSSIMLWMHNNIEVMEEGKDLKALMHVKEQRSNHEASKFATLEYSINNKDKFSGQIDDLNKSTSAIPRYKKRYSNNTKREKA